MPQQKKKKIPKKYTLRFTLVSAFCGLSLLGVLLLTLVTSYEVSGFIREELRLRISDVARIMANQIDGDLHSQIKTLPDANKAPFIQLKNELQAMRERGTGIANAYTMRKTDNGEVMFIVDGSEKDQNAIGDIYPSVSVSEILVKALDHATSEKNIAYTESEIYKDDWGVWLSAYAPIFTSAGKVDGIVGIDVSAQNIWDHEFKYILTMLTIAFIAMLVMIPFGFLVAARIRKPLAQLAVEMEKIGRFDLESDVEIVSRVSEIISMTHELEGMKKGLLSFKKYVPAELVKELIELGTDAKLGGEKKNLTIFFSDIANFTAISERLEPEKLVDFLGEYLNVMNLSLLKNQATVDKYIGDSVMAFWGAPRNVEQPAIQSCHAALECQRQIQLLSQKWKAQGLDFGFYTRIGIHTGDVIVGNIGSDTRMNYTVIGDNVNLASRIESASKFYGTSTLISETTYQEVKEHFVTRLIDFALLVGKATPIRLYELVGNKSHVGDKKLRHIELYEKAFDHYSQKQFSEAIVLLEKLVKHEPSDRPAILLLERCQHYKIDPPTENWQGDFVLPNK